MQPLDRTVFRPFKKYVNSACDDWVTSHPGKKMSMYEIPKIGTRAYPLAFTQGNIVNGFKCTEIHPLNQNIFIEKDIAPSLVMDRLLIGNDQDFDQNTSQNDDLEGDEEMELFNNNNNILDFEASVNLAQGNSPEELNDQISVDQIRPLPRAPARKFSKKTTDPRTRKSDILTHSPVMLNLEVIKLRAAIKKSSAELRKTARTNRLKNTINKKKDKNDRVALKTKKGDKIEEKNLSSKDIRISKAQSDTSDEEKLNDNISGQEILNPGLISVIAKNTSQRISNIVPIPKKRFSPNILPKRLTTQPKQSLHDAHSSFGRENPMLTEKDRLLLEL